MPIDPTLLKAPRAGGRPPLRLLAAVAALAALATPAFAQPANDDCTGAVVLAGGIPASGTTSGATLSLDIPGVCTADAATDVWYRFQAPTVGAYRFEVNGTNNGDLSMAIVSGCGGFTAISQCKVGSPGVPLGVNERAWSDGEVFYLRVGSLSGSAQNFSIVAGPLAPPVNDECSGALTLTLNTPIATDNLAATTSLSLTNAALCGTINEGFTGGSDVFYAFTAPSTDYYSFSTCGSEIDTVLSVHSACPATGSNVVACNDNAPIGACGPFDTFPSFIGGVQLTGGQTYYVRVASALIDGEGPQARFTILAASGTPQTVPANDLCTNAEQLLPDVPIPGTTINATGGTPSSCAADDVWAVWYSFTSPASVPTIYTFNIFSPAFNNQATLSVYDACGGNEIACQAFNPFMNPDMSLHVSVNPSQTLRVRVAGLPATQGEFVIQALTGPETAVNVSCGASLPLTVGTPAAANTFAASANTPSACGDGSDPYGLWYSFQAPSAGWYRFSVGSVTPGMGTTLTAQSSCAATSPLFCSARGDAFSGEGDGAAGSLSLAAGQLIYLRVAGTNGDRGDLTLNATGPLPAPPAVPNDSCGGASTVSVPFAASVNITNATRDAIANNTCVPEFAGIGGVWYRYTPLSSGYLVGEVGTNDQGRRGEFSVYTGSCGSLTRVSPCPNFVGVQDPTPVSSGVTYYILASLSTTREDEGAETPGPIFYGTTMDVSIEFRQPPTNDDCETAQRVETDSTFEFNTVLADHDTPRPSCIGFTDAGVGKLANAVWYTFTTASAGSLTVEGEGVDFSYEPGGALFSGSCGNLTQVACDSPVNGMVFTNHFEFTVELAAGTTYYLAVGSYAQPRGGDTSLSISYTGTFEVLCPADLDNGSGSGTPDGGVDINDLLYFLVEFESGSIGADLDNDGDPALGQPDGGVDVNDLLFFLARFELGC